MHRYSEIITLDNVLLLLPSLKIIFKDTFDSGVKYFNMLVTIFQNN